MSICISSIGMAAEKVCWPLNFAGVTLGITTDPQVTRLLGEGLFQKNVPDTGERIFVDKKHTATLQTVSFTDWVVGEVTLAAGVEGISKTDLRKAESSFFNPEDGFGNWHELQLGSTQAEVEQNLGEPAEKDENGGWVYYTACACELPEYFTIYFTKGRIGKVVFSAPPG